MFIRTSITSSLVLLLCACSSDQTGRSDNQITANITTIDSCEIALTQEDQILGQEKIRQYQSAVISNRQPLLNLEKLGWAYIAKARSSFDNGYYNLALETSKCLSNKRSEHPAVILLQAYVSHQLHQFKKAETLARKLVQQRGHWFEIGLLGDALMEQGRLDEAEKAYQSMMNQRPGPQAYSRAAHLRWLKGDLAGAIEMAALTAQAYGHSNKEPANWAKSRLGFYFFLDGNLDSAEQVIDRTLELDSNYPPALFIKGRLELARKNANKAVIALSKAVELNPAPEYLWTLIEALSISEVDAQGNKITAQFEKTATTEDPRTYALYLSTTGRDHKKALKLAKLQLDQQQDIFSHDAMAWTLYTNKQFAAAVKHIQNALSNDTHDPRLYYHAAVIHLAANDQINAGYWFTRALHTQHLLLPSEQLDLQSKFKKFQSNHFSLDNGVKATKDILITIGDQNENTI